jgi:hypothetical protein
MFVTVIHRIHDPKGFQDAEVKALESGLPPHVALPIHASTDDHGLGVCIWEDNFVDAVRGSSKARSDHGQRTSTTRCTWTDSARRSQGSQLIPARPEFEISISELNYLFRY